MSTKSIRKALQAMADTQDTGLGGLALEALAEVRAIEKAGRYGYLMMSGDIHMGSKEEAKAADTVFSAIYEATGRSEG